MAQEKPIFANGVYFNLPHRDAPDFVLGSMSVKPEKFIEWIQQQEVNEYGYVRMKVLMPREGDKPYVCLDTYKGKKKNDERRTTPRSPARQDELGDDFGGGDDIPF